MAILRRLRQFWNRPWLKITKSLKSSRKPSLSTWKNSSWLLMFGTVINKHSMVQAKYNWLNCLGKVNRQKFTRQMWTFSNLNWTNSWGLCKFSAQTKADNRCAVNVSQTQQQWPRQNRKTFSHFLWSQRRCTASLCKLPKQIRFVSRPPSTMSPLANEVSEEARKKLRLDRHRQQNCTFELSDHVLQDAKAGDWAKQ